MAEADYSLEVRADGRLVFSSSGRWLHPLLDLENFLKEHSDLDPTMLNVRDKIVGRAAALLMVRMRLGTIHAVLLSRLGLEVFVSHGVLMSYDNLVDRIDCQTEDILRTVTDPDQAHKIIKQRAAQSQEAS